MWPVRFTLNAILSFLVLVGGSARISPKHQCDSSVNPERMINSVDDEVCLLQTFTLAQHRKGSQWNKLVTWMTSNGAQMEQAASALSLSSMPHGGMSVRGVITSSSLPPQTNLFVIPDQLWLKSTSVPDVQSPPESCESFSDLDLWGATRLAIETRKGSASFYAPYIQGLPSMEDYRSFHPKLAGREVLSDFQAMGITNVIEELQADVKKLKSCFADWQAVDSQSQIFAEVTWDDFHLAHMRWRTRCYETADQGRALIPASDLMNTAKSSELNVLWDTDSASSFKLSTERAIAGGGELYDSYCSDCDNAVMLETWGIYLEDNPNKLRTNTVPTDCNSKKGEKLRAVVKNALALSLFDKAWTAPRCKNETLAMDQGPLYCSLARLAWEQCSSQWTNHDVAVSQMVQTLEEAILTKLARAEAAAVTSSRRKNVHPSLLSHT